LKNKENENMADMKKTSIIAQVTNEIGTGSALDYLKSLGKGVVSNRLKAMVAAASYVGSEWTKKKGEAVMKALSAFDINSERQAKNYVNAGRVIIKSQMSEQEALKVGLSRLMTYGAKLLDEEVTDSTTQVETAIREYEGVKAAKAAEAETAKKAAAAQKKQETLDSNEMLNEEFDEEEGLTDTRVWAHITVWADSVGIGAELRNVCGDNAVTGLKKLSTVIKNIAAELAEKEAKETSEKATGTDGKAAKTTKSKK
jgi:hypothetical protein